MAIFSHIASQRETKKKLVSVYQWQQHQLRRQERSRWPTPTAITAQLRRKQQLWRQQRLQQGPKSSATVTEAATWAVSQKYGFCPAYKQQRNGIVQNIQMLDYVHLVRQIAGQGNSLNDELAESDEDPDENTPTPVWQT